MAVGFEIRHPQSETSFSPQKTQNFASVIELKIATLGGSDSECRVVIAPGRIQFQAVEKSKSRCSIHTISIATWQKII
jgi:hypothetical protein